MKQQYEICHKCGKRIYYGNQNYEQTDYIKIDGVFICEDCISEYMLKEYYARLAEV